MQLCTGGRGWDSKNEHVLFQADTWDHKLSLGHAETRSFRGKAVHDAPPHRESSVFLRTNQDPIIGSRVSVALRDVPRRHH